MQLNARVITGFISFSIGATGIVLGNMLVVAMIGEINCKKREWETISYFRNSLFRVIRIFDEYMSLYPKGKFHIYSLAATACGFIGMLVTVICIAS